MVTRNALNFWLDLVSLLVMLGLALTGGLMHYVLPPGTGHSHALLGLGRHDLGQIHFYLAAGALLAVTAHVWLHWRWVCCVAVRRTENGEPSRRARGIWGLVLAGAIALVLGGGLLWASGRIDENAGVAKMQAELGLAKHEEDCPAGSAINGRITLSEAATACRLSVEQLRSALKLPANVDPSERLGQLKRSYEISIHEVRRLACQ